MDGFTCFLACLHRLQVKLPVPLLRQIRDASVSPLRWPPDSWSCAAHEECNTAIPEPYRVSMAQWLRWHELHFQQQPHHLHVPFRVFLRDSLSCPHAETKVSAYDSEGSSWGTVSWEYTACCSCGAITHVKTEVEA